MAPVAANSGQAAYAAAARPSSITVPGVEVTGWTSHSVGLTWSAPDAGNWTYWVRVDGTTPGAQVSRTPGRVRANVPVTTAGVHRLQVVALDSANRRAESAPAVSVDTRQPFRDDVAPEPPPAVQPAWVSATSASLFWDYATDNTGAVANYEVSADGGQTWVRAFRTVPAYAAPRYTVLGLPPGTSNRLGVRTVDGANQLSSPVFVTAVTTPAADRVPPSTPANLGAVPGANGSTAALTWQPSTDGARTVARYSLSYADDPRLGLSSALLYSFGGSTGRTQLSIADLVAACTLGPGRYTVDLRAFDATGNISRPSNIVTFVV